VTSEHASAHLLASYVRVVTDHWADLRAGPWRLALAVVSPNAAAQQVGKLAEIARATVLTLGAGPGPIRRWTGCRAGLARTGPRARPRRACGRTGRR
jgi:hypothetical protein